jgi:hypothetical protein
MQSRRRNVCGEEERERSEIAEYIRGKGCYYGTIMTAVRINKHIMRLITPSPLT